jgi:hypothetical protein
LNDEIVRKGARRMLGDAPQAEVDAYIARHTGERDGNGRRSSSRPAAARDSAAGPSQLKQRQQLVTL